MQDQTLELIKEYISTDPKYNYKTGGTWFNTKYVILYEDTKILETAFEDDAIKIINSLNGAAKASFIEGAMKTELKLKYNSINFMRWTLSEACQYRTTSDVCCPTCKIWFNITDFNDIINTDELYQKWQNGIKKHN